MRHCLYRLIYMFITTVIFTGVMIMCGINISKVTSNKGLQIVATTDDSIILDGGMMRFEVALGDPGPIEPGVYVPIVDALKPHVQKAVIINIIIMTLLCVLYIIDILDLRGYISMLTAKKGMELNGEIVGYDHVAPLLYKIRVDAHGTTYRARFPIFNFEKKRYPEGKRARVWNGGVKHIWVDVDSKS